MWIYITWKCAYIHRLLVFFVPAYLGLESMCTQSTSACTYANLCAYRLFPCACFVIRGHVVCHMFDFFAYADCGVYMHIGSRPYTCFKIRANSRESAEHSQRVFPFVTSFLNNSFFPYISGHEKVWRSEQNKTEMSTKTVYELCKYRWI